MNSLLLCLTVCAAYVPAPSSTAPASSARPHNLEMATSALRSVHFVPNHGQWTDKSIHYGFRGRGLDIAFHESALTMHLRRAASSARRARRKETSTITTPPTRMQSPRLKWRPDTQSSGRAASSVPFETLSLEVTFPGSNPATPRATQPKATRFNYFLGDDASNWRRDVPSFQTIIYEDLYEGIDLHIAGCEGGIVKYAFHCAPGSDYTQIKVRYIGIETLHVDRSGDLLINTSFGTLRDTTPVVWQELGGTVGDPSSPVTLIPARLVLLDNHSYTIALESKHDPSLGLVIDPEVDWMTYLGGSDVEWAFDVALNTGGGVLVTGYTASSDFEGGTNGYHGGNSDVFVARVDPSGTVEWMTYLGGSGDLTFDVGRGIELDGDGNILLTGWTNSPDFAGANNTLHGIIDAFVARLDPAGVLDWMTYLGGTADDLGFDIAVDGSGAALITGDAYSTNFDGANNSFHGGNYDSFATRVHASGTLDWMTYLGGGDQDEANGIKVDADGAAFVAGDTWSGNFEGRTNFPLGNRDAYVARIDPEGTIDWMVYLGGGANEVGAGIVLDAKETLTLVGYTTSIDFVGANNTHHGGSVDSFVAHLDSTGTIDWMTYLGGSEWDSCYGLALDAAGGAVVCGRTESLDFEARDNTFYGIPDAYIARVTPSGTVDWMSYLGGSGDDAAFGIALDAAGGAMLTGRTNSVDFDGRINDFHGGGSWGDAFALSVPLPKPGIAGDLNDDGIVDIADLLSLLADWGHCPDPRNCPADLDGDGCVGTPDLLILLANWT